MVINMLVDNDICISSALEDYLESIYEISKQKTSVRITDIALALKISKPSVNRAVNTLKKQGLVSHEPYGDIILTEKGFELGEAVYHRHTMIKKFLVNVLHIPEDDAEKEACQIEHNISQNTVEKFYGKLKRSTENELIDVHLYVRVYFHKKCKGKPYIKDRLAFVYNIRKLNSNIK